MRKPVTRPLPLHQLVNVAQEQDLPARVQEQLELTVHAMGEVHYKQLYKDRLSASQWIISHIAETDAPVEVATGGETYLAQAGDVLIHPPYFAFSERNSGSGFHQFMVLDARLSSQLELFHVFPLPPVVRLGQPQQLREVFRELSATWRQPQAALRDYRIYTLSAYLLMLLIEAWEAQGRPARPAALQAAHERFNSLIEYMHLHCASKLSRAELAEVAHMHPNYLDEVFRKHFRKTPMEMLRHIRLTKAAHYLQRTTYTLDTIASLCGIGDGAYFSKLFKREYGVSPGEYRKQAEQARSSYLDI